MTKTFEVGTYTVKYDLDEILAEADEWLEWDEDMINPGSWGSSYGYTEKQFNDAKAKFIAKIKKADGNFPSLFKANVEMTGKGKMHKSKKYPVIESGMTLDYDDEYGSHKWNEPVVRASATSETTAELIYDTISRQSPF